MVFTVQFKSDRDRYFEVILRCMWMLVSFMAVYIFFQTVRLVATPDETLGIMTAIPEMTEHLLASCVVATGFGCLLEYLNK